MSRKIFVNLAVKDLAASISFFKALGFTQNLQFTDDTASSIVISDEIYLMLLTHDKFMQFSPQPISDARTSKEVLICLSCDSRAEVDALVAKAVAAGGTTFEEPQDHGFMYGHSFLDLDGHAFEMMYMNMDAMPKA